MGSLDDDPEFVSVLYYGPNGTGKTTDLAHMAHLGEVIYMRADRGLKARPLRAMGVPTSRIQPVDSLDPDDLLRRSWEWAENLHADPAAFTGVCLDTVGELIKRRMEAVVDSEWDKMVKAAEKRGEEPDKDKRYFVDRDYWQPITQQLRRLVRFWTDMPCHVGIAAQTRRDVDDDESTVQVGPDTNPAFQGDLIGYMDIVVRTEVDGYWPDGEQVFIGHPRREGKYLGKDRLHVLPRILVEPTFDRIVAYATGQMDKDSDPRQAQYRELVKERRARRRTKADTDD